MNEHTEIIIKGHKFLYNNLLTPEEYKKVYEYLYSLFQEREETT